MINEGSTYLIVTHSLQTDDAGKSARQQVFITNELIVHELMSFSGQNIGHAEPTRMNLEGIKEAFFGKPKTPRNNYRPYHRSSTVTDVAIIAKSASFMSTDRHIREHIRRSHNQLNTAKSKEAKMLLALSILILT